MTSSVMSRTDSPPLVRSCVSCWKTFTVRSPSSGCRRPRKRGQAYFAGFGRISEMRAVAGAGLVAAAARVAAAGGRHLLRRGATGVGRADRDVALHALVLVAVDRAVHLVAAGFDEGDLERRRAAGGDLARLLLDTVAFDLECVRDRALVDRLELVSSRLAECH